MGPTDEASAAAVVARERLWTKDGLEGLVVLVGSSPLPNAVAILALAAPRILLAYTPETKDGASALIKIVTEAASDAHITPPQFVYDGTEPGVLLADASDSTSIRGRLEMFVKGRALFYTGGTKPMAVHAHAVWREKGGKPRHACHLSDAKGLLGFDSGDLSINVIALPEVGKLTIDRLGRLHELMTPVKGRHVMYDRDKDVWTIEGASEYEPTVDDASTVLDRVLADPNLVRTDTGSLLSRALPDLTRLTGRVKDKAEKAWGRFRLKNIWLEIATAALVEKASRQIPEYVMAGTRETVTPLDGELGKGRRPFNLDVAHRIGARLFAISCTTERDWEEDIEPGQVMRDKQRQKQERDYTKLKMFEVEVRARQIGGDLARSAVVCLAGPDTCQQLKNDVQERWVGDDHPPAVFGIDDLRAWRSCNDLSTLQDFLCR